MAITLPLPLRVAAGILATGIDRVRALPEDLPALPVTLVGSAMKLSIKVQQEIATLATRGDELLGGVIGAPVENPTWAKFDDDEPATPITKLRTAPRATPAADSTERPVERDGSRVDRSQSATAKAAGAEKTPALGTALGAGTAPVAEKPAAPVTSADLAEEDAPLTTPVETSMPPGTTTAMEAALEVDAALIEEALLAVDDAAGDADGADVLSDDVLLEAGLSPDPPVDPEDFVENPVILGETAELTEGLPVPEGLLEEVLDDVGDRPAGGPVALAGYDGMSLAQVRGHLRELSADDVSALLRWEQEGESRPPFLTLLSNRLVTLDAQNQ